MTHSKIRWLAILAALILLNFSPAVRADQYDWRSPSQKTIKGKIKDDSGKTIKTIIIEPEEKPDREPRDLKIKGYESPSKEWFND